MSKQPKKPQDHQRKGAAKQLRDEAANIPGIAETQDRRLTISGRLGDVTVTTLNMLDWDARVPGFLRDGDYLGAICGMVSPEDAARLAASSPTLGAMMTAIYSSDDETGESSVGESQAS